MKYLFYITKKYSLSIIVPIIIDLQKRDFEIAILCSKKVHNAICEIPFYDTITKFTTVQDAIAYNPDFSFVPGNSIDYRIPGIIVQIFHGIGVEKPAHYKIRHLFDVYCTSGPYVTTRFKQQQKRYKYFEVIETGWAKVDYILDYKLEGDYSDIADKVKILYAPTFSNKMESAGDLLESLPTLLYDDEILYVKFHELMDSSFLTVLEDNDNIKIIGDEDITKYLHLCDIMISDTSSVVYEFMLLNKPVVTYRAWANQDKCRNILNVGELRGALDDVVESREQYVKKGNEFLEQVNPYRDGKISQNLIDSVLELKRSGILEGRKKPANLFRKFKTWYKEIKKKV